MEQRLKLAGELKIPDDFVVLDDNPDGTVLLGPQAAREAMKHRLGGQDVSHEEFDRLFGDLGPVASVSGMERRLGLEPISDEDAERLLDELRPHMLPPDGEGDVKQRGRSAHELHIPDDFLVLEEHPDGTVLLGPDTSWQAIKRRQGVEEISQAEFDELFGQRPTDDEG